MRGTLRSLRRMVTALAVCVAAGAPFMRAAASGPAQQNASACEALRQLLDQLGHRTDSGRGWTFSGGDIELNKKQTARLALDLKILQGLQDSLKGQASMPRAEASYAASELTRSVKASLPDEEQVMPKGLRLTANDSGQFPFTRSELDAAIAANAKERQDLDDSLHQTQRAINEAEDRLAALNCNGGAPLPPKPPATGGDGGGGDSSKGDTGGGGSASSWEGVWKHDFGTMNLDANLDATSIAGDIETANGLGPELECDRSPKTFLGEMTFTGGGGFDNRPWTGRIVACTHGDALEGKFSNIQSMTTATAALGPRSAGFQIRREGAGFTGSFVVWDSKAKQVLDLTPWKGGR